MRGGEVSLALVDRVPVLLGLVQRTEDSPLQSLGLRLPVGTVPFPWGSDR